MVKNDTADNIYQIHSDTATSTATPQQGYLKSSASGGGNNTYPVLYPTAVGPREPENFKLHINFIWAVIVGIIGAMGWFFNIYFGDMKDIASKREELLSKIYEMQSEQKDNLASFERRLVTITDQNANKIMKEIDKQDIEIKEIRSLLFQSNSNKQ